MLGLSLAIIILTYYLAMNWCDMVGLENQRRTQANRGQQGKRQQNNKNLLKIRKVSGN
jgi:hypothetical protein